MALWTPAEVNTALWFDHSDVTTQFDATSGGSSVLPNGSISRLDSKSSTAANCSQTSTARPLYRTGIQNGLSAGEYDGSNDVLLGDAAARAATANVAAMYLATVVKVDNFNSGDPRIINLSAGDNSGNQRFGLSTELNSGSYRWRAGVRRLNANSIGTAFSSVAANDAWTIVSALANLTLSSSDPNAIQLFVNGTLSGTGTLPGTSGVTSNNSSVRVSLGNLSAAGFLAGYIGEVVLVVAPPTGVTPNPGVPTLAQMQTFDGYLAHKWGLAANLPADHPYKSSAPGDITQTRRRRFVLGGYGL